MPSNSIYDILQDNKGFMWFATDEGVTRFDGRYFKTFKSKSKSNKNGSFLKKDSFGRIWYETFDGYLNYVQNDSVCKINQGNPIGFVNYSIYKNQLTYATQNGYEILDLKNLKITKKQKFSNFQTCYLETINQKTYFFDPFLQTITLHSNQIKTTNNGLVNRIVAPIFTTSNAIYCTDKSNTNKFIYKIENGIATPIFQFITNQTIQNLYFLQNKFWICTNKGLFVLDKNGKKINKKPYFENFSVTSFFIDNKNNYWIGTLNDGVLRFSDFNEIQSDLKEIKPLLLSVENSNLYVGSENGSIYSISKDFGSLKELHLKCKNQILYINNSHPKFNFIAADGMYKTNKKFEVVAHENYALKSMDFVTENEAIVAVSGFIGFVNIGNNNLKSSFGNFKYTNNQFRLKENIRGKVAVWNTLEKEALFLTNIGLFSYKNNQLTELKTPNKETTFKTIKKAKNKIYLISDTDKLYQYYKGTFIEIKTNLEEITFFKNLNNTLFLGSKNTYYLLKNNKIQKINAIKSIEKIQDLQFDSTYYYVLNKQNIIRFNRKNTLEKQNKNPIYLEKFWVNNVDFTHKNKLNLQYNQNDLRIQVAMIDYEKKNSVFYKINSDSWKEILNNGNILQLSSLSPNTYQIVFSTQKNGVILQKVNFEIQRPFWEKLWFLILISFLFIALIITIYYNRLKQITAKNNLIIDKLKTENYLNESKVKLIKAQMNPHFFFNALNTIQSFITTNETDEATSYLNKFSRLTRMILEMTDKNWITIEDELRMQTLYLDLQKVRLSDFEFQIKMNANNIQQIAIPTMLLQPYVENAIIHGLAHKLGLKRLIIDFKIENNILIITISDNGIGLEKATKINLKNTSKNASFATKATLERLEIINKNDRKISVETSEIFDKNNETLGTEVKIHMEIRYEI